LIPAPTLAFRPGDTVIVHLYNDLEPNTETSYVKNSYHGANSTNLHTHGLHVDPNVDTVFIQVEPGQSHTYKYLIPDDHPPGIQWYHSHKHGASAMQVMGGLIGALLVQEPENTTSTALLQLAQMRREQMVLHHFSVTSTNTGNDPFA
jgi:FtsP/CotA-like multicopper oxidase with cupredoxin domain